MGRKEANCQIYKRLITSSNFSGKCQKIEHNFCSIEEIQASFVCVGRKIKINSDYAEWTMSTWTRCEENFSFSILCLALFSWARKMSSFWNTDKNGWLVFFVSCKFGLKWRRKKNDIKLIKNWTIWNMKRVCSFIHKKTTNLFFDPKWISAQHGLHKYSRLYIQFSVLFI